MSRLRVESRQPRRQFTPPFGATRFLRKFNTGNTPIFLPVAKTLGIDPLFFGVLMVVNLAIGCITPPVGLDLFVASAITKVPIEKVMKASLPYLFALLVTLVILTMNPWIITFLPDMLK